MASRTGIAAHHSEWLALVDASGPFLTLPVLTRAFPNGLDEVPPDLARTVGSAYDQWQADPTLHGVWARWVLTDLLGFDGRALADGQAVPATLTHRVPEHGETLRPDLAVLDPPGTPTAGRPRLLVTIWPGGTPLDEQVEGSFWAASPNDRMAELLRAKDVRVGLVTNGERWVLVNTGRDVSAGFATWDAALWLDDRITLAAFRSLLSARRFFGVDPADTLERLLEESANAQQEVTDQLGFQVRRAVELLVEAFSRANRESGGELLAGVAPETLYGAAVAVMMRLVFLLSAEERGLFLLGDELYDASYAVSTLRAQLQAEADRFGEEPLEKRTSAWHRLLAIFRMVHAGVQHEDLRLPAYGGSLFDPERHPFLEGRQAGERWQDHRAAPLPIDDRTVLHLLSALQVLSRKGQEAQRLSYRALDVEQIGHVYEGLLDHTAVRVDSVALGLEGKKEPEVALSEFEAARERGVGAFVGWLADRTGRTPKALEKALATKIDTAGWGRLLAACGGSTVLTEQLAPYHALLRRDLRGLPVVFLPDSIYVTAGQERRGSGTYYTPRALAEEVVKHTLDPLVYHPGPAEGADPADWKLKPADQLLDLKVCDIAMGSGAFLVAACRYLAARVVESWTQAKARGEPTTSPGGHPLPDDPDDWELHARRLVADRCLYGVDKNPMAVEMAKLSVWLVTLAKGRPFEFVDHALRCGDSLLGITSLDQLINFHPDPVIGRKLHLTLDGDLTEVIQAAVGRAVELRRRIESFPVLEARDAEEKGRLLTEADQATDVLRVVADTLVGAALSTLNDDTLSGRLLDAAQTVGVILDPSSREDDRAVALTSLRLKAATWLQTQKPPHQPERRCFHWALEFPEVLSGFQAIVGNPPFQGGHKITGALGTDYREWLVIRLADGRRGSVDLVAYFFLRASQLITHLGGMGLLATNTIAQGNAREVVLDHLTASGWTITRAVKSRPWPGDASLEVAEAWLHQGAWSGQSILDGETVPVIAPTLDPEGRVSGKPQRLSANVGACFIGTYVLGTGFFLLPEQRDWLIRRDPRNAEVLFPYMSGDDLTGSPSLSPSRWVINFFDWPYETAAEYADCFKIIEEKVKPERSRNLVASLREKWWQYKRATPRLYSEIAKNRRVLAISLVGKTVLPAFVATGMVYGHKLAVFAYDDDAHFGLLSSAFHWWWVIKWSSTLETRVNYSPTDCFETFPEPTSIAGIADDGRRLHEHRRALMLERSEGLTKTYNRVHDREENALDVVELRRLHVALDHTVASAYGWNDLPLDHDFYETRQGTRYTVGPAVRTEILDRLLELNHERYAEEVRLGLHDKPGRGGKNRQVPRKLARPGPEQTSLLE